MKTRTAHLCLLWLALSGLASSAHAAEPPAQTTDGQHKEAGQHFERGVALYNETDYQAALVEFKRAYELAPHYKLHYNVGQTSFELKDYVGAQRSFERYLFEGAAKVDAQRRKKVTTYLEELRTRVAHLTVKVSSEGADVSVDDAPAGKSPLLQALVVNVGRRTITVTKPGFKPAAKTVDLAGGDSSEIEIVLAPKEEPIATPIPPKTDAVPAAPPSPQSKPTAARAGVSPGPWVAFGLTAATAVGAGITGGLALSSKSDYDDEVAKLPGDAAAISAAGDETRTFSIATDVLIAAAGAGAVVTLILFVTDSAAAAEPAAAGPVQISFAPNGLTVFLSF